MPDTLMGTLMERNPHIRPHPVYTAQEQELHDLLNKRPMDGWPYAKDTLDALGDLDLPAVPKPPLFRVDTPVVGQPGFAKVAEDLMRIAPEMRGRAAKITQGPTPSVIDSIDQSPDHGLRKLPDYGFGASNQLGQTTVEGYPHGPAHEIGINNDLGSRFDHGFPYFMLGPNPSDGPATQETVLGHELAHVMGYNHGPDMRKIEDLLYQRYFPEKFSQQSK